MSLASSRFLDPETLGKIRDLRLVARTVVEGFLSGLHADARPAAGVEFSQFRAYEPGDDLRRVDWRAFARSDRFVVRESNVERDVTIRFLLDASASMAHRRDGLSTFDYARLITASLAYLVDRQGDRLAFHALPGNRQVLPGGGRGHRMLDRLLEALEHLEPAGRWPGEDAAMPWRSGRARGRELVVILSDLHEHAGEIGRTVSLLRSLGDEVLVLQLMARDELEFPYAGDLEFEDLETGQTVRGNAANMRDNYLQRVNEFLRETRDGLLSRGVTHELLMTDRPLDIALRRFLLKRLRLP